MKCHYIYDKEAGKVLIPGCWGAIYGDMSQCTCRSEITTFAQFEKKEYNKILNEKQSQIKELEKEVARLNRILKRVNGFR